MFEKPAQTFRRLSSSRYLKLMTYRKMNPELLWQIERAQLGLLKKAKLIPYLGFTARSGNTEMSWGPGEWDSDHGLFAKYASERRQAGHYGILIEDSKNWGRFPSGR